MNQNILPDYIFDMWSKELADLQLKHPDIAKQCVYHDDFKEFDGSTGAFLPFHLPEILNAATRLLKVHKKFKEEGKI
ncbi:hypothetical protein D3C84_295770 [compost metagenome]